MINAKKQESLDTIYHIKKKMREKVDELGEAGARWLTLDKGSEGGGGLSLSGLLPVRLCPIGQGVR